METAPDDLLRAAMTFLPAGGRGSSCSRDFRSVDKSEASVVNGDTSDERLLVAQTEAPRDFPRLERTVLTPRPPGGRSCKCRDVPVAPACIATAAGSRRRQEAFLRYRHAPEQPLRSRLLLYTVVVTLRTRTFSAGTVKWLEVCTC